MSVLSVLLLPECQKESDDHDNVGSPVVFTAAAGYDNGEATRTAYSGLYFGTSAVYERINWVQNDRIRIYSTEAYTDSDPSLAYADYKVTSVSANGQYSNAQVAQISENSGLIWGPGVNKFYALYPAPSTAGVSNVSITGNLFDVNLPATQTLTLTDGKWQPDMNTAYMWAAASATSTQGTVTLSFRPAVTAFEFTIHNPDNAAMTVTTFSLSSTSHVLNGLVRGTISNDLSSCSYTLENRTSANSTITVNFGASGVVVPVGDSLTFTVFAAPQNLTNLTASYTTSDNVTRTLPLSVDNVPYVFTACKKYRITNHDIQWTYIVEEIEDIMLYGHSNASKAFTVKSYKVSDIDPDTKVAVPWKIQYTTDNGSTWTDLPAGGVTPGSDTTYSVTTAPTGNGVSNSTYSAGEGRTANIIGTHDDETLSGDPAPMMARLALQNAEPRPHGVTNPTAATAFDLSKHPVYGSIDTEGSQNTANCYVVSAPGWYKFPLVYGNAIKGGVDNKSAYWPAAATTTPVTHPADPNLGAITVLSDINTKYNTDNFVSHYYLPQFYNALNQPITSPYILTDLGIASSSVNAVVLWQDMDYESDLAFIPYDTDHIGVTSDGYIWFHLEGENLRPGNFVIALRRNSDNLILWSWHIWITEKDLTPKTTDQVRGISLMPTNLGFLEGSDGAAQKYVDRKMRFRVIQVETVDNVTTTHDDEPFMIKQTGEATTFAPSVGSSTYYQWGRKDPIIPSLPGGGSRYIIPNPDYASVLPSPGAASIAMEILPASSTVDYATSITKPYKPLFNQATTSWVGGPIYPFYSGWRLTKEDRGPFLESQRNLCIQAGFPGVSNWYSTPMVVGGNTVTVWYLNASATYNYGPYTTAQMNILLQVDPAPGSIHFHSEDFQGIPAATAAQRSESAIAYNLWNSFIYSDGVNTRSNKFKTIYDPCPPGFTVPIRYLIVGNTWPLTWIASQPGTPIHRENANPMALSPAVTVDRTTSSKGVYYNGVFFPYVGGRILVYTDLQPQEQGTGAYYWTDNPFNMQGTNAPAGNPDAIGNPADPTNINDHWFYQFGLILSTNNGASSITSSPDKAWSFTKGSGGAIRPMVDPEY